MAKHIDSRPSYQDEEGKPFNAGRIYFGVADSDTKSNPITVYADSAKAVSLGSSVLLDQYGKATSPVHVFQSYSYLVEDSLGNQIESRSNVVGMPYAFPFYRTVDNLAALKALNTADNTNAFVLGHTTKGDGGGGAYYFDSSNSTADNNGTIIEPDSGTGRWVLKLSEVISVRQFGASASGSAIDATANTAAFRNWAAYLNANTPASGYVPAGHYVINGGFILLDDVTVFGDGHATLVDNQANDSVNFFANTCIFLGTYFGFQTTSGADQETGYALDAVSTGDRSVNTTTAGHSDNFSAGDVVFIESSDLVATIYPVHAHVNEVLSASGGVVTLRHPIADDYPATSTIKRATSTLDSPNITGIQSETKAKIAKRATVKGLRLRQSTDNFGQAFHIACYDSHIENIYCDGVSDGFGINPCAHTSFRDIKIRHRRKGFEMAYLHNDCSIDGFDQSRIGHTDSYVGGFSVLFNESGQDVRFQNFIIRDYAYTGDGNVSALGTDCRRHHFSHGKIIGSQGSGISFTGEDRSYGSTSESVVVVAPSTDGIDVSCDGVKVDNCTVLDTPVGQVAIDVATAVTEARVTSNQLGAPGATTTRDIIRYAGTSDKEIVIEGNSGHQTKLGESSNALTVHTGTTSATDIETLTIAADASSRNAQWDVVASGNVTGTNGDKTIKLQVNGVDIATLTIAAADIGLWSIAAKIVKKDNDEQFIEYAVYDPDGTETKGFALGAVNTATTAYAINLEATLANASDTINFRHWAVTPSNDQYDAI